MSKTSWLHSNCLPRTHLFSRSQSIRMHSPCRQCVLHCHCLLCPQSSQTAWAICSFGWVQFGGRELWRTYGRQQHFDWELVNLRWPGISSYFASTRPSSVTAGKALALRTRETPKTFHQRNTNSQQISIYFPHSADVSEDICTWIIGFALWVSEHRGRIQPRERKKKNSGDSTERFLI